MKNTTPLTKLIEKSEKEFLEIFFPHEMESIKDYDDSGNEEMILAAKLKLKKLKEKTSFLNSKIKEAYEAGKMTERERIRKDGMKEFGLTCSKIHINCILQQDFEEIIEDRHKLSIKTKRIKQ